MSQKILIIDDDDSIRWVLEKAVNRENLTAITASDANNVPEIISREKPSVIISDIKMPNSDGLAMLSSAC